MATRVAKLAVFTFPNVSTSMITVPPGVTWIVKSVIVYNNSGLGDNEQVWAQDVAGHLGYLVVQTALAAFSRFEWSGFFVMLPGDQLFAFSTHVTGQCWVSGTVLPGTA